MSVENHVSCAVCAEVFSQFIVFIVFIFFKVLVTTRQSYEVGRVAIVALV